MNDLEQRKAAKAFAANWQGKGYEKGESQPFWLQLLGEVLGVEHPAQFIKFEGQVMLDHTSFIDAVIPSTHVLIEQKSLGKNLKQPIRQSDGSLLTPFQQAKRYTAEMPYSERPRWIVVSNFEEFHIYDMEKPYGDPEIIYLKDLPTEYYRLQFLVGQNDSPVGETEISLAAGEIVGKLYDALLKQYKDPTKESSLKSLNMLCVRLVFCFYAEDASIFNKNQFKNYLSRFEARDIRRALIELFCVLDQKETERDEYIDADLAKFPYVNGGLFEDENIEIPQITEEIKSLLVNDASADFDWRKISPTIFGAVFESTLNPQTRRSGGMHYTSIENIHKVIDPLFLNELKNEFEDIKAITVPKRQKNALLEYQKKLASLAFLDPACGSGNFLTETYICLRKLENEALKLILGEQIVLGDILNPIMVSIKQLYGIEINDFAVSVAKTALWIAENQMLQATEEIIAKQIDFLPLKTNAYVVEGNALRMDWESVIPKEKLNYIMGNPPFVGYDFMNPQQKEEMQMYFGPKTGRLDYVTAWYMKAAPFIIDTSIKCAFVSTNSITQGVQVPDLWLPLIEQYSVEIIFAYKTFRWDSEASLKAHVHCVIIGFCNKPKSNLKRIIFSEDGQQKYVTNISPYLIETNNIIVEKISSAICQVPNLILGNMPKDGGGLILSPQERKEIINHEPLAEKWIRRYLGAYEFINNKDRYCLWLVDAAPAELRKSTMVMEHVKMVQDFRYASKASSTRKLGDTPTIFAQISQPSNGYYIAVPKTSSERRKYIPMGFLSSDVIVSDLMFLIPNAELFHFGVLESNVHMSWMRAVAGRLKSDYRYSRDIVYNTFPWPTPTEAQKAKIEKTAQAILDARALYPDSSLADLYDELTMPPELRKAHQANDRAVMEAYGFWGKLNSEAACVAELMKMYQQLVEKAK